MKCKKCGIEFIPTKGLLNYCSLKCRNSRQWSIADKRNKSNAAIVYYNSDRFHNTPRIPIPANIMAERIEKSKRMWADKLLAINFEDIGTNSQRIRKRISLEQFGKCNNCQLDTWLDKPLVLELHHKDGNTTNLSRQNLECLCPNCHSITDTWRGRGARKQVVTDIEFCDALIKSKNIRQALLSLNLVAKGGNYARAYQIIKHYNIAPLT